MREILFRGKDRLGHWLYGGFHLWEMRQPCVIDDELKPEEIKHIIIKNSFADWNMPRTMQPYVVIPSTVGQYTGLTDKNGTKIFEGDILQFDYIGKNLGVNGVAFVNFQNGKFGVEWGYHKEFVCLDGFANTTLEVIGNIHDNPELLRGDNNA